MRNLEVFRNKIQAWGTTKGFSGKREEERKHRDIYRTKRETGHPLVKRSLSSGREQKRQRRTDGRKEETVDELFPGGRLVRRT